MPSHRNVLIVSEKVAVQLYRTFFSRIPAFATSALSLSLLAWHATVSLARIGTHDVLVLRKGTGAVTLGGTVERAQLLLP